jgi:BMFP domain-containing protein YqiC
MTEDDPTKDLTDEMTDRQILLELRRTMGDLVERVTALEHRTNPLPPNYDERFAALEANIAEIKKEQRITNQKLGKLALDVLETHAQQQDLAARVDALESRPN